MEKEKRAAVGILAHVDAGKTTLAESILYLTGSIRKLGRVDHKDAFLDTDVLERERGITIFSKQAQFQIGDMQAALLDTPGHTDFSAEMERTLQVLDYAVLVISGADGIQGHVETLWRLLKRYRIPVFLFINKMDQDGTNQERLMKEIQERLDDRCLDFSADQVGEEPDQAPKTRQTVTEFWENLAMCDDVLMEKYLDGEEISFGDIARMIQLRKVFPCYFGSALKLKGVEEFLEGLKQYMKVPDYPEAFGARVFKISRDDQGNRLSHMKITGGVLQVKMLLSGRSREGKPGSTMSGADWEEKADQIRIYSGTAFQSVQSAGAGCICAVTGLTETFAGQGLGRETETVLPVLEPVLSYRIILPEACDIHGMYKKLKQLEEEEPELSIVWEEAAGEIHAQVMGDVQMEVLKSRIMERFGVEADFGEGSIVYKETILNKVEGIGHFEPLRHYAEVHLLMEPLTRGGGLVFETDCSEDTLDRNWQRLIFTHLAEKRHRGVLTGAEITDMKITLAAGRAHLKHTEGGDFRQATYRAVRHGLRRAECVLLEPVYDFLLEVPQANVGRAMADIQKMYGSFDPPDLDGEFAALRGSAPVVTMRGYQREVTAYTGGRGRLTCVFKGYDICHNAEEVTEALAYDPEADSENPAGSVFCAHGAGFVVPWDEVTKYMHLQSCLSETIEEKGAVESTGAGVRKAPDSSACTEIQEKELWEIFERTYGPPKRDRLPVRREFTPAQTGQTQPAAKRKEAGEKPEEYLLVDGYNILFAWEELHELSAISMEGARNRLMEILCNYQAFRKCTLILVFDAYKVKGGVGEVFRYHNIYVVYTKEAETADQYIEKTVHRISRRHTVTVATSDALEQVIICGQGAMRLSAREFREEIESARREIMETCAEIREDRKNYLFDHLPEDMAEMMEDVRLGRKEFGTGGGQNKQQV